MKHRFLGFLAFLAAAIPAAAHAQPCPDYAYNRESTSFDETAVRTLVNWFRQFDENEWEHARSVSNAATIPIEDLLVNLSFRANDEGWRRFRREIESYSNLAEGRRSAIRRELVTVDQAAVAMMRACLTRDGLHVWTEASDDTEKFVLAARFNPSGAQPVAYIRSAEIDPGLACIRRFTPVENDSIRIGPEGLRSICNRTDSATNRVDSSTVDIVINASENPVEGSVRVPRIPQLDPADLPPATRRDSTVVMTQPFHPRHRGGDDRDFHGHGPIIQAWAEVRINPARTRVYLHMFMSAHERGGGGTWASGRDSVMVYSAPQGYRVVQILSPTRDEASYTDTDHVDDAFSPRELYRTPCRRNPRTFRERLERAICLAGREGITNHGLVRRWTFVGDTAGDESGSRTGVQIQLNPVKVTIEGRSP